MKEKIKNSNFFKGYSVYEIIVCLVLVAIVALTGIGIFEGAIQVDAGNTVTYTINIYHGSELAGAMDVDVVDCQIINEYRGGQQVRYDTDSKFAFNFEVCENGNLLIKYKNSGKTECYTDYTITLKDKE